MSYGQLEYTGHAYEWAKSLNDMLADDVTRHILRENLGSSLILTGPTFSCRNRKNRRNSNISWKHLSAQVRYWGETKAMYASNDTRVLISKAHYFCNVKRYSCIICILHFENRLDFNDTYSKYWLWNERESLLLLFILFLSLTYSRFFVYRSFPYFFTFSSHVSQMKAEGLEGKRERWECER